MSDDSQFAPIAMAEPTEARFTIRSLFVVMAIVAVIAALAGPLIRMLPRESQIRLLIAWGTLLAMSIAWIGYQARKRFDAEMLAGRTVLRLPMFDQLVSSVTPFRRRLNIVLAGFMTLIMMFAESEMALNPPPGQLSLLVVFNFGSMALMCVWWTSRVATSLWWRTNVRFGEFGVLWDRSVLLWDHIASTTWNPARPDVLEISGIDQHNCDMHLSVLVPSENRAATEVLFNSKVVQKPSVEIQSWMAILGRAPLSVAVRDSRFIKFVGRSFLVAVAIGAGTSLFRSGLTGIREFDESILFGFIFSGIMGALWRRPRAVQVGAPLVRLATKRGWLPALAAAVAAYAAYWIGYTLGSTSESLAYASGIGFGGFISTAITCLTRKQLDLRANGIYMQGNYWPWNEIQLLKWIAGNGQLALGRGWRRVVAFVPFDQREAVDRVLREKVA